ncbi:MAG: hypothetical protein OXH14_19470, partial [Alphaproteobacteria bacterium]|nr:hypothetical protein [Alphaproteobacteria bacterium]
VEVATEDDRADEPDGSVSVTVKAGAGYTVASAQGSATVAVRDNDDSLPPPADPEVSVSAGSAVTEGGKASFTISASPAPSTPFDVTLTVAQGGDVAASGATGNRTVTVPVAGSVTVEVATQDDSADEPDGSVSVTVKAGTGYTVAAAQASASVAVRDNDDPAPDPETLTLSVADATAHEREDYIWFTVRLSAPSAKLVTVRYRTRESTPVSARRNRDYLATSGTRTFPPDETVQRFRVRLHDDAHDEPPETFEVVLSEARGATIADGVAVGTIVNTDPMPAAYLGRVGRTVAEQSLDSIADRIGTLGAAAPAPGFRGAVGGVPMGAAPGFAAAARESGGGAAAGSAGQPPGVAGGAQADPGGVVYTGLRQLLAASHFSYTGKEDNSGGVLGFWGRGAQTSFDGREGALGIDGAVKTAILGADYARSNWLAGVALTHSLADGGYRADQPAVGGPGVEDAVDTTLTAAIPYASWQASARLSLWGAAGYGVGEVTLGAGGPEPLHADLDWTMAAAGLRSDLFLSAGGGALALVSDAMWTRTGSERVNGLAASGAGLSRLRIGLQGSWRFALPGGGSLAPKLEVGARRDGGDAETGSGVEVGGGFVWTDPGLGLKLDIEGRTLVTHEDGAMRDRGFSASFTYDPRPGSARGPWLALRQDRGGPARGGLDALFANDPVARGRRGPDRGRWHAEAGYGLPVLGGRFVSTPHARYGLSHGARETSLGWRLAPEHNTGAPEASLAIVTTRREHVREPADHRIGIEIRSRW